MPNKQRFLEIENIIVHLLEINPDKYYLLSELTTLLPIHKHEHKYLKNILNKLTRNQTVIKRGKRFGIKTESPLLKNTIIGTFDATSLIRGYSYAFVKHPDGDILIDSEDTNTALHNDKVLVQIKYKKRGLLYGIVNEVTERANKVYTGNIEQIRQSYVFLPDMQKIHLNFTISNLNGATHGDKVIITIDDWGNRQLNKKPTGKVIEILGKAGKKEVEELAIFKQYDLPLEFPEMVVKEVEAIEDSITDEDFNKRLDLRELYTITIDPPTAKDYDDAISLEVISLPENEGKNHYKLYVHIADVSHYVKINSAIFNEAVERGNSFYFPRRVVPMLPEKLSNKICSLRPDEDKLTLTVITHLDHNYKITKQSVHQSIIRSSVRLNYDEVDDFFAGKQDIVSTETGDVLKALRILSDKLTRKRYEKGYIPFNMPELEIIFNDDGEISELKRSSETESHKLVENCMLAANEYVAELLSKKSNDAVYRVHEDPEEEALEKVIELLHYYKVYPKKSSSMQKTVQNLLTSMPSSDFHRVFDYIILRSMKKARYETKSLGHFGLATRNYTHFTSPIRRICDLTVHHLLRIHVWKETTDIELLSGAVLKKIAENGTERELLADSAERETEVLYKRMYMKDKVGMDYTGMIVNLSNNMIIVELNEIPITGLIAVNSLLDDQYRFYSQYMELVGRRKGKVIRLMDKVKVQVSRVDFDLMLTFIEKL